MNIPKGPYQVKVFPNGAFIVTAGDPDDMTAPLIASCNGRTDASQTEAIAHAIGALPDLIEALEKCLGYIEYQERFHCDTQGSGNAARAALAKTKGPK